MSNGDVASGLSERLWIARFLVENHDRLRARLQRRLRGQLHVAVDIDDIMSSTLRRVDDLARQGRVRAVSEAQLCSLFATVAHNVAMARLRTIRMENRFREAERANGLGVSIDSDSLAGITCVMAHVTDDVDREILDLKRRGLQVRQIALVLRRREAGVFKRWERLRNTIRCRWGNEPIPGQSPRGTKPTSNLPTKGAQGEPKAKFL